MHQQTRIEKSRECSRKWKWKNAEHVKAYSAKWKKENAEHVKRRDRIYRKKNAVKRAAEFKAWRKNNPEWYRQDNTKRYARLPEWALRKELKRLGLPITKTNIKETRLRIQIWRTRHLLNAMAFPSLMLNQNQLSKVSSPR